MPNKDCDMPECVGENSTETRAARGPSGELIEICAECLNDGWFGVVEVVE
jgi:hypothetical protein